MALEISHPSPLNPTKEFPNAYERVEAIHIEPTERSATALTYIYEDAAAAELYKKQRRQANTGDGFAEDDPQKDLPQVQPIGQVSVLMTADEFDVNAFLMLQLQNNPLEVAYNKRKSQLPEGSYKNV